MNRIKSLICYLSFAICYHREAVWYVICSIRAPCGRELFISPSKPVGMAQKLIQRFKMEKIPAEGPWFTVTYRSEDVLDAKSLPVRYKGSRVAGTAIYAVQTKEDFSAIHKLMTDEIWHFYGGDPLEMLLLYPDGRGEIVVIGPDVFKGQHPQFVVPG